MMEIHPGYKFRPTDEELISHYLHRKVNGELSPIENQIIRDCDLYGQDEPWHIWERFGGLRLEEDEGLFFFTALKRKSPNNTNCKNISRRVGSTDGHWHCETSGRSANLEIEGFKATKKRFNYRNSKRLDQDRCWNMLEYSLDFGNYVLCQLKTSSKNPLQKKKRKMVSWEPFLQSEPNKRSRIHQELQEEDSVVTALPLVNLDGLLVDETTSAQIIDDEIFGDWLQDELVDSTDQEFQQVRDMATIGLDGLPPLDLVDNESFGNRSEPCTPAMLQDEPVDRIDQEFQQENVDGLPVRDEAISHLFDDNSFGNWLESFASTMSQDAWPRDNSLFDD
ncbi:hypothetical protein JCGZ_08565 [Jatropha curcas]|uniref:NAC transcription factor 079 n=1 Tax=Jatropha curcas TaxID=180498 RepID=R4NHS9_JATCU|nr:NAC transcription factor 079 [Jatropha curcas]KDP36973.1 hypothetical protein JCGZ_08565 [Jatropha curcas]